MNIDIRLKSEHEIQVNGRPVFLVSSRDIKALEWDKLGVKYVLECTGKFTKYDLSMDHVSYGHCERVIISAPSSDSPTLVYGVNTDEYVPSDQARVVSCASCTTNCVAPILKVLDAKFGISQGFLTTIHASTQSQHVLDGYSKKNRRLGIFLPCLD